MHNSSSSSSHQSGWFGYIRLPLSESTLALPLLAPTGPHYQQPTSSLQGQPSATTPPTSSISRTHRHWTHRYAQAHAYKGVLTFPHTHIHSNTAIYIPLIKPAGHSDCHWAHLLYWRTPTKNDGMLEMEEEITTLPIGGQLQSGCGEVL